VNAHLRKLSKQCLQTLLHEFSLNEKRATDFELFNAIFTKKRENSQFQLILYSLVICLVAEPVASLGAVFLQVFTSSLKLATTKDRQTLASKAADLQIISNTVGLDNLSPYDGRSKI
jgi:hypothetical protein